MRATFIALLVSWLCLQAALFTIDVLQIHRSERSMLLKSVMGWGLIVGKASAMLINLNTALLILSKCRVTMSALPVSLAHFEAMHGWFGGGLIGGCVVHVICHIVNYARVSKYGNLVSSGTTITGILLCVVAFAIVASLFARNGRFHQFFLNAHLPISVIFLLLLSIHGTFCLLKRDNGQCNPPSTWKWIVGPVCLVLLESLLVFYRTSKKTEMVRIIAHPSQVIELQFDKPSLQFRPGQYVYMKIPLLSLMEWHPFTLTASPHDELKTVHIRLVGDWTRALARALHIEYNKHDGNAYCNPVDCLPSIIVDGPYGSNWDKLLRCTLVDRGGVIVCIGAGIGQTPFASILKTWWYTLSL